jgi:outer membrane protein assembly factor BamB
MRRLLNFCLMLVLLASVGYLLYKAKLLPGGRPSVPTPAPTVATAPPRDALRVSVSHRPEALLAGALKRLLDAESLKVEVVNFDPETSWMELAAGELDLVIAPLGEAVTAQARFQAGRFLFVSGLSEGYDLILARAALSGAPKTLGIPAGPGAELFALQRFPDSRLVPANNQAILQSWLREGAIEAALLESASLAGELASSGKKLGSTSAEGPLPTVVVLSRALVEENANTTPRIEVLLKALDAWSGLIDYLSTQPDLLRSILKQEAEEMGVNLDVLLKDYRFLTPRVGREILDQNAQGGLLKQTLDLLLLARTPNLTAPNWDEVLALPPYLSVTLPGQVGQPAPVSSPTPIEASPTPLETPPSPQASPAPEGNLGTHSYGGSAPPDPWPQPVGLPRVAAPLPFPPALTNQQVGVATEAGFEAFPVAGGERAFALNEGGRPLARPLADARQFYLVQSEAVKAVSPEGKVNWTFPIQGTPGSQPWLTDSHLILTLEGPGGSRLLALSKTEGKPIWETPLEKAVTAGPLFADTPPNPALLLVDAAAGLTAWNPQSGQNMWVSSVGQATPLGPSSRGNGVAVLEPAGAVRLLSLADGTQDWEIDLGTPLATPPTVTEELVLVPAKDTTLYALDRQSGAIKKKVPLSGPLSQPAVVVGDHVYCADELGSMHSLKLADLSLQWSRPLAQAALFGPIFSDTHWALLGNDGSLLVYPR